MLLPDPVDPAELSRLARKLDIHAMIGTHAYLSGKPFLRAGAPYVLVLGGTDVNEFALDGARLRMEPATRMFLLPAGLRQVKDPLYLISCISRWHDADPRAALRRSDGRPSRHRLDCPGVLSQQRAGPAT